MPKSTQGLRRGVGRPKGVQNKVTVSVKQALTAAFEGMGGVPALMKWGKENPGEYYKLWAKMLPQEVSGVNGGPIQVARIERIIIDPANPNP